MGNESREMRWRGFFFWIFLFYIFNLLASSCSSFLTCTHRKALMWARFVRDVTVPDGSVLQANEAFTKTWRFRNELDQPWPQGTRLLFVGKNSDRLGYARLISLFVFFLLFLL